MDYNIIFSLQKRRFSKEFRLDFFFKKSIAIDNNILYNKTLKTE